MIHKIYCFLSKVDKNKYGLCIIFYNNYNIRIEYLITINNNNYEDTLIESIIKIINFCYTNNLKNYVIFTNINNCIKILRKNGFNNYINFIKLNNIRFKNYGKNELNYKYLAFNLIKRIPIIYNNINECYNNIDMKLN